MTDPGSEIAADTSTPAAAPAILAAAPAEASAQRYATEAVASIIRHKGTILGLFVGSSLAYLGYQGILDQLSDLKGIVERQRPVPTAATATRRQP